MNEYILLFRMDITTAEAQPTAAQMQQYMQQWTSWITRISARGQLAAGGNHLSRSGAVVRPGSTVEHMPYTANRESVAGYIIILAADMNEALIIAGDCPILNGPGNSVEVRQTATPGN